MIRLAAAVLLCLFSAAAQSAAGAGSHSASAERTVYTITCQTTITDSNGSSRSLASSSIAVVTVDRWNDSTGGNLRLSLLPTTLTDRMGDTQSQVQLERLALELAINTARKTVKVEGLPSKNLDKAASRLLTGYPSLSQLASAPDRQRVEKVNLSNGATAVLTATWRIVGLLDVNGIRCARISSMVDGTSEGRQGRMNSDLKADYVAAYETGELVVADITSQAKHTGADGYTITIKRDVHLQTTTEAFYQFLRERPTGGKKDVALTAFAGGGQGSPATAAPLGSGFVAGIDMLFCSHALATGAVCGLPTTRGDASLGAGMLGCAKGAADLLAIAGDSSNSSVAPVAAVGGVRKTSGGGGAALWIIGGAAAIGGGAAAAGGGGGGGGSDDSPPLVEEPNGTTPDNGQVTVDEHSISLTLYDHSKIDGDIIDVIVNGVQVVTDLELPGPPGVTVTIQLQPGDNSFTLHADNEGWSPPSTPAFIISNVNIGTVHQLWRLKTDQSGTITITVP